MTNANAATMRAVEVTRYGDPSVLRVREVPRPTPGPGEALVRVRAASVSSGDARVRARARALATAAARERAGGELISPEIDLRARAAGACVHLDVDVEGGLKR